MRGGLPVPEEPAQPESEIALGISKESGYLSVSMSRSDPKTFNWPGIGFLLLVSLIAVSFFFSPGTGDVAIWQTWMREISSYGVIGGFAHTGTDYPPLAFIILGALVRCAEAFGVTELLVLKCSLLLFLFATTAGFYWFTRNLVLS